MVLLVDQWMDLYNTVDGWRVEGRGGRAGNSAVGWEIMDPCTDGWIIGWMTGWMDGWMEQYMGGSVRMGIMMH